MAEHKVLSKKFAFILVSDLDWTMKEVPLGNPDVLVCSVGTEIFFEASSAAPEADKAWSDELSAGWDRTKLDDIATSFKELERQAASEQRPHKLSYSVMTKGAAAKVAIEELESRIAEARLRAKVIYSGGADLDILPAGASKGKGLEFLLKQIEAAGNAPPRGVLVCGDSGNDVELFAVPGVRGCMVANAHPELREWCDAHASPNIFQASKRCAWGIIEALEHFGLVPPEQQ